MSDNLEAVMRRIQKLLAMAEDGRGDPNEAAAAAAMASKLMRKFQLDHADVIMAKLKKDDEFDEVDVVATAKTNGTAVKAVPTWVQWMAIELAKLHDVRVVIAHTGPKMEACIRFMGFKADTAVAGWTLGYLVETVNRLCVAFRQNPVYLVHGRKEMNAYRHGVVVGINIQLRKAREGKEAEERAQSNGRALVIAKERAVAERYGELKTRKGSKAANGRAFGAGLDDGLQVDVNRTALGSDAPADPVLRLGAN